MDDVRTLVVLACMMMQESPRYQKYTYSPDKATLVAQILIEKAFMWVAEINDEIVGFFAGSIDEQVLSRDTYSFDIGIYILPQHRGSRAFMRLVKAFETWSLTKGVKEICIGVSSEIAPDCVVRMYERLGYKMSSYGLIKAGN